MAWSFTTTDGSRWDGAMVGFATSCPTAGRDHEVSLKPHGDVLPCPGLPCLGPGDLGVRRWASAPPRPRAPTLAMLREVAPANVRSPCTAMCPSGQHRRHPEVRMGCIPALQRRRGVRGHSSHGDFAGAGRGQAGTIRLDGSCWLHPLPHLLRPSLVILPLRDASPLPGLRKHRPRHHFPSNGIVPA